MKGLSACLLLLGLSAGCTRNLEPVDMTDSGIKARLELSLRSQADLNLRYVTVDVYSGVATISGLVNSQREKDLISRIVRQTRGVDQAAINVVVPE
ncbi:MAG: BON domain-containing protein [Elusimicrobiota bacterium]|jgi:osmotically-inducible protein OsmY